MRTGLRNGANARRSSSYLPLPADLLLADVDDVPVVPVVEVVPVVPLPAVEEVPLPVVEPVLPDAEAAEVRPVDVPDVVPLPVDSPVSVWPAVSVYAQPPWLMLRELSTRMRFSTFFTPVMSSVMSSARRFS